MPKVSGKKFHFLFFSKEFMRGTKIENPSIKTSLRIFALKYKTVS
jgi:hypothetical protein